MPLKPETIEIINTTASNFGARRVILFGSALRAPESEIGDIDIAVQGLSDDRAFDLSCKLAHLLPLDVDVINLDGPSFVAPVAQHEGMEIYAKP